MPATPPKPRLALSVGIVGHRPNRLAGPSGVEAGIVEGLDAIAAAAAAARSRSAAYFSDEAPALTLISGLAEGADRIAAAAALEKGYALAAILPFPAEDYERDFADGDRTDEFRRLLAAAARRIVLPGTRAHEAAAYEAAGIAILENSDMLIAVWDGGASAGRGGTTEIVERAARAAIPIVMIDAGGTRAPHVLWSGLATHPVDGEEIHELPSAELSPGIATIVERLLAPPSDPDEKAKLSRFLAEQRHRVNWRIEVPLLLALVGLRWPRRSDLLPRDPDSIAGEFERANGPAADGDAAGRDRRMSCVAAAFGWADATAVRYAQVFRGAFSANFLFAALAVVAGATGLVGGQIFGWQAWPLAVLEVGLVSLVFLNTFVGRRLDWHNRWRESREVAERLRAAMVRWNLSDRPSEPRAADATWTGWYGRATMRAMGVSSNIFSEATLEEQRQKLKTVVLAQAAYHEGVAALMQSVERRLELLGQFLFGLTIVTGGANMLAAVVGPGLSLSTQIVLTGITAALPALGAATFGVRLIGDFEGVANRSERTGAALKAIGAALAEDAPHLSVLRWRARVIAETMLGDVSHWRVSTESRKLVAPS